MLLLHPIPSRSNNYIWALVNDDNRKVVIVDPGESDPVINWLTANDFQTADILITHHHDDHIAGIPALIQKYKPTIYAPKSDTIVGTTHGLSGGEDIYLESVDLTFSVLAIPGHTQNHLAYYAKPYLFCGDTLFSAGCGRLLGGTIEQLYDSLELLKQLPDNTLVCCAHEYTLNNIQFAKQYDANNINLLEHEKHVQQLRSQNQPSLPTSIKIEKAINPFFRAEQPAIQQAIAQVSDNPVDSAFAAFARLRALKDNY